MSPSHPPTTVFRHCKVALHTGTAHRHCKPALHTATAHRHRTPTRYCGEWAKGAAAHLANRALPSLWVSPAATLLLSGLAATHLTPPAAEQVGGPAPFASAAALGGTVVEAATTGVRFRNPRRRGRQPPQCTSSAQAMHKQCTHNAIPAVGERGADGARCAAVVRCVPSRAGRRHGAERTVRVCFYRSGVGGGAGAAARLRACWFAWSRATLHTCWRVRVCVSDRTGMAPVSLPLPQCRA